MQLVGTDLSDPIYPLLIIYIISIPLENYTTFLSNVVILTIIALIAGYLLLGGRVVFNRSQLSIIVLLSLFFIWFLLSSVTAEFPVRHLSLAKTVVLVLVVTVAGCVGVSSRKRLHSTVLILMGLTVTIGLLTIVHVIVPLPFGKETAPVRSIGPIYRTFGVDMKYATYGIMASFAVPYLTIVSIVPERFFDKKCQKSVRNGALIGLLVIVSAIIIGQSRSTYISLTAVTGTLSFLVPIFVIQKRRPIHFIVQYAAPTVLFAGICATVILFFVSVTSGIFNLGVSVPQAGPIQARYQQYLLAIQTMVEQPLFGVGARYIWAINSNHTVHNLWLLVGTWSGFPGFIIWVSIFGVLTVALFRRMFVSDRRLQALQIVLLTSLVGTTIELAFWIGFRDILAVFMAITVGSLFIQGSVEQPIETPEPNTAEKGN